MNISSVRIAASLSATIFPSNPLASGEYQFGTNKLNHDLSTVTQLYGVKASSLSAAATLDLRAGLITGGGAGVVITGGNGEDLDCQSIDLAFVHALHFRNTSLTEILTVEITQWAGGTAPFDSLSIPAAGEFVFVLPSGEVLTAGSLVFTSVNNGGFEFVVVGKN